MSNQFTEPNGVMESSIAFPEGFAQVEQPVTSDEVTMILNADHGDGSISIGEPVTIPQEYHEEPKQVEVVQNAQFDGFQEAIQQVVQPVISQPVHQTRAMMFAQEPVHVQPVQEIVVQQEPEPQPVFVEVETKVEIDPPVYNGPKEHEIGQWIDTTIDEPIAETVEIDQELTAEMKTEPVVEQEEESMFDDGLNISVNTDVEPIPVIETDNIPEVVPASEVDVDPAQEEAPVQEEQPQNNAADSILKGMQMSSMSKIRRRVSMNHRLDRRTDNPISVFNHGLSKFIRISSREDGVPDEINLPVQVLGKGTKTSYVVWEEGGNNGSYGSVLLVTDKNGNKKAAFTVLHGQNASPNFKHALIP